MVPTMLTGCGLLTGDEVFAGFDEIETGCSQPRSGIPVWHSCHQSFQDISPVDRHNV